MTLQEADAEKIRAYLKRRYMQLNCLVLQGQDRRGTYADEAEEIAAMLQAMKI